jgi:hypothetical protein
MVEDPEPGAAMDAGLKVAEAPEGKPEALNAIAELKPAEAAVVILMVPLAPGEMVAEVGEAEIVKPATVRVTVDV